MINNHRLLGCRKCLGEGEALVWGILTLCFLMKYANHFVLTICFNRSENLFVSIKISLYFSTFLMWYFGFLWIYYDRCLSNISNCFSSVSPWDFYCGIKSTFCGIFPFTSPRMAFSILFSVGSFSFVVLFNFITLFGLSLDFGWILGADFLSKLSFFRVNKSP